MMHFLLFGEDYMKRWVRKVEIQNISPLLFKFQNFLFPHIFFPLNQIDGEGNIQIEDFSLSQEWKSSRRVSVLVNMMIEKKLLCY